MPLTGDKLSEVRQEKLRRLIARAFDLVIIFLAIVTIGLAAIAAVAPRFQAAIPPDRISAEGGHAFTFGPGFTTHWPYAIPSHPGFALGPDDVKVSENGRLFGSLEPAHDTIRALGDGRFNFWEGGLWFSSSDNTDPRTNGRTYGVRVKAQLIPYAALALAWSFGALAALICFRLGAAIFIYLGRLGRRWMLAQRSHSGLTWISGVEGSWLGSTVRFARRMPLTFGRTFVLVSAVPLIVFCWGSLARPMPLFFQLDSVGYVHPGLVWASGGDPAGQSARDLGYPILTVMALRLGSLDMLPRLQLLIVAAGLACVLGVLYHSLAAASSRLRDMIKVPRPILGLCAGAGGAVYCLLLLNHDAFVVNIYSAMAEAPHVLPTALAMLLFIGGWTSGAPGRRVCFAATALVAAYLSIMVKPHTSLVVALCAVSLLVDCVRRPWAFRSPLVIAVCIASAALIFMVNRLDTWVTPPGDDFGAKTLFCNHLDVIDPGFDTSTPERARIRSLLRGVLQAPDGWPVMGYDGDHCVYNQAFTDAIIAAAKSEKTQVAAWQQREFAKAVLRNPVAYGHDVLKQMAYYLIHPIDDVNYSAKSSVNDDEWQSLRPFAGLIRISRDQFDVQIANWVPDAYPALAAVAKRLLRTLSDTFAVVTLGGTALALIVMITARGGLDLRLEITLVATAAFTLSFAMATAVAHTFDVGRYLTDLLPFTVVWWVMSLVYVGQSLVVVSVMAARKERSTSFADGVDLPLARNDRVQS